MNNPFTIYVHIPFCAKKCAYCDFYSLPSDKQTFDAYTNALCAQINALDGCGAPESVYLGGGTPSLIGTDNLSKIISALSRKFSLSDAECTAEVNPESVGNVLPLVSDGTFNRISMGVQSFDDEQLAFLGRIHSSAQAVNAYNALRRHGAKNVSLDVITALPTPQREEKLQRTLDTLVSLDPEHVSAYMLSVEEGTPLALKGVEPLDGDEAGREYLFVSDFLQSKGYEQYEISNFARDGKRSVHNSAYWKRIPYIGLGAGAVGFDGKRRYKIPCDVKAYISSDGMIEAETEEILTPESAADEALMLALRTKDGYPTSEMNEKMKSYAARLIDGGFGYYSDDRFSLTPKGWAVCNTIISDLLNLI